MLVGADSQGASANDARRPATVRLDSVCSAGSIFRARDFNAPSVRPNSATKASIVAASRSALRSRSSSSGDRRVAEAHRNCAHELLLLLEVGHVPARVAEPSKTILGKTSEMAMNDGSLAMAALVVPAGAI